MADLFQGLLVTLREGIEAVLLVALTLAALERAGRQSLRGAIYAGVAAALVASLVGALLLRRVQFNEEAFEGVLYLAAALMVGAMLLWMRRNARGIRVGIEQRIRGLDARDFPSVWAGLFLFCFFTVFREGLETVVFLGALSFDSEGVTTTVGAGLGILAACVFAFFFIRGSLRVDLRRFFRVTTVLLAVLVVQLAMHGFHELSEAGLLPGGPTEMAIVGPLVRYNALFLAAVLLVPVFLLLSPGGPARQPQEGDAGPVTAAARRTELAALQRTQRARVFGVACGMAIVLLLGLDTLVLSREKPRAPAAQVALESGLAQIPVRELVDGQLHHYATTAGGKTVRFLLLRQRSGAVACALDACLLCGDRGYAQEGAGVICLNCAAEINVPTIGQPGGCNPIPLRCRVEGDLVMIAEADLVAGARYFR